MGYLLGNSPIARSAICGESLVFIKKSLKLAAKYVTQRMHHLQGHWFWKEMIEPLGDNTPIHIIFRSRLSPKMANPCDGRIELCRDCQITIDRSMWKGLPQIISKTDMSMPYLTRTSDTEQFAHTPHSPCFSPHVFPNITNLPQISPHSGKNKMDGDRIFHSISIIVTD